MSQYALRLPDSLMEAARKVAKRDSTSLNQLFLTAIAEKISEQLGVVYSQSCIRGSILAGKGVY